MCWTSRPMRRFSEWGWEQGLSGAPLASCLRFVDPGKGCSSSTGSVQLWHVLAGTGYVVLDGELSPISAGDTVSLPVDTEYVITASSDDEGLALFVVAHHEDG